MTIVLQTEQLSCLQRILFQVYTSPSLCQPCIPCYRWNLPMCACMFTLAPSQQLLISLAWCLRALVKDLCVYHNYIIHIIMHVDYYNNSIAANSVESVSVPYPLPVLPPTTISWLLGRTAAIHCHRGIPM